MRRLAPAAAGLAPFDVLLVPLALLAAALAGGCDWRDFDTQAQGTPVLSVGAPAHYADPRDFGRALVAVAPPANAAARYLVSGVNTATLALVDLDAAGQPTGQALNPLVISEESAQPITALAEVPGQKQVLMGAPASGAGRVYLMDLSGAEPNVTLFQSSFADDRFGIGVAAAQLTGSAAPELIVASATKVSVYVDGDGSMAPVESSPATCPITLGTDLEPRDRLSRPVVVVGDLVAVGTPSGSVAGTVTLMSVTGGAVTCVRTLTGAEGRFGQALAVGDFNADGVPDLLVGAPPRNAYMFPGPLDAPGATATILYPNSAGEFGAAMAAMNVDGQPGDEALIADSDAAVGGTQAAGSLLVYGGPTLATQQMLVAQHDPGTDAAYGSAVTGLRFCPPPCAAGGGTTLPLVGAATRTFTYFVLGPASVDPRHR
jgi:hypothetical protein